MSQANPKNQLKDMGGGGLMFPQFTSLNGFILRSNYLVLLGWIKV